MLTNQCELYLIYILSRQNIYFILIIIVIETFEL